MILVKQYNPTSLSLYTVAVHTTRQTHSSVVTLNTNTMTTTTIFETDDMLLATTTVGYYYYKCHGLECCHHTVTVAGTLYENLDLKLLHSHIGYSKENLKIHTGVPAPLHSLPSHPSLLSPPLPFFPLPYLPIPFPSIPISPFP